MPSNPLRSSVAKPDLTKSPKTANLDMTGMMHITLKTGDLRPVTYRIPEKNWPRFRQKHAGNIVCAVGADGRVKKKLTP